MQSSKVRLRPEPFKIFAILLLPLFLSACFSFEEVELKQIDSIHVVGLSPTTLSLEITATVDNPNNYKIKIKDPDIDLFIEKHKVGKLEMDDQLVLSKDTVKQYTVPIHTELDGSLGSIFPILLQVMASNRIRFGAKGDIKGSAKMFSQRIDVDIDQEVDLSGY